MLTPAAPAPASRVWITRGGGGLRSTAESRLWGTGLVGSAGSTLMADVTSARPSSGAIATLNGGPTTLVGTAISATTRAGVAPRSMIVIVSGAGLRTTCEAPFTSAILLSLTEIAICRCVGAVPGGRDQRP